MKRTVLYVVHNHPSVRPGGAEVYAYELFRSMRRAPAFDAVLLAKSGPPVSSIGNTHAGTCIAPIRGEPQQYFVYTDGYHEEYDWIFGTFRRSKELHTKHLRGFLEAIRPDVVHFQHTLFLGYDVLRLTRNVLPDAPIVYTLHEFMPICHRQGQMVRTMDDSLCLEESPRRCHECFPDISPQTFFMRKRFVQSHLQVVDLFVAPSRFLRDRFVDWGVPPDRIVVEDYGRDFASSPAASVSRDVHNRIGFFGQLSHYKGVNVLLEAMTLLGRAGRSDALSSAHAWIHGTNLDLQPEAFRERFAALLEKTADSVTFAGTYDQSHIAELMANVDWVVVPSIWGENSPLVIQEAAHHGRPVICSNIGGMAEKVDDGVTGLHFRAGDARSLAATLERAITTPGLFDRLQRGIRPPHAMGDHVRMLTAVYEELLETRAAPGAARVG
jgi:glycosyltransferase involved in cell wall biosynthesis